LTTILTPIYPISLKKFPFPLRASRLCGENLHQSFNILLPAFCSFIAKICIFLFLSASNSKLYSLLITPIHCFTNRIQREFDSNVAIRTFEIFLASKPPRQKTNFPKHFLLFLSVLCVFVVKLFLLQIAEVLKRYPQTESKGNFCLITVYNHKTLFQPQAIPAKRQTFSNKSFALLFIFDFSFLTLLTLTLPETVSLFY
jgi:hypothetical protein